jgi:hypothetical protein
MLASRSQQKHWCLGYSIDIGSSWQRHRSIGPSGAADTGMFRQATRLRVNAVYSWEEAGMPGRGQKHCATLIMWGAEDTFFFKT